MRRAIVLNHGDRAHLILEEQVEIEGRYRRTVSYLADKEV